MRRLVVVMAGVLAFCGAAPSSSAQAPQTVGIRLVDVPTSRADDPRARQYIVDHLAPGTTITRRVEVSNGTGQPQVQLYAAAATNADGHIHFGDGRAANDLTSWTTVDPPTVTPAAGARPWPRSRSPSRPTPAPENATGWSGPSSLPPSSRVAA